MARLPDWEARLSAYLATAFDRAHAFGEHDCILHGANAHLALTGDDPAAEYRETYSTELGAARLLKRLGHDDIAALVDSILPSIPTSLAQRGDPVLADGAIGICIGTDAVFVGQAGEREGLVRTHRREWQKAWAIR